MRLAEHFFRIIAPSKCLFCGTEGKLVCAWCIDDALPYPENRCYKCNRLTAKHSICPDCKRKTPMRRLYVRTDYSDTARQLVHKMKFNYSLEAADIIASEMAGVLPALDSSTLIAHVPTITSHIRQRGFDHAKRIAAGISEASGLSCAPLLNRIGQHRHVGSSRKDRLAGVADSFRAKNLYMFEGKNVLLVDDVVTTGSTIEEAATELKKAGGESGDAVVFAKAK